jgi:protein SCO1/2
VSLPTRRPWKERVLASAFMALGPAVAACSAGTNSGDESAAEVRGVDDGFAGTLVADPPLQPADVALRDTHGRPYRLTELSPDRVTAVFFGFTHCPDVCPTAMADLSTARRMLPDAQADLVDIVFITVDPQRDTRPVLERWLGRFDPDITGLRGPVERVHEIERSLYSPESEIEAHPPASGDGESHDHGEARGNGDHHNGPDDYEVSHSGLVYLFGPEGRSLFYTAAPLPDEYTRDMLTLLAPE